MAVQPARIMVPSRRARAANWVHVGQTQGRGKVDVQKQFALHVKDVFLKPIHSL